jgi:hypothetical protein
MGRRLLQTRLAFLGGSDVLCRPTEDVIGYLETVGRTFPIVPRTKGIISADDDAPRLEGIHVFLDEFTQPRPCREALRAYRDRHLIHVDLGIESGDPQVRRLYGKSWDNDDLRATVSDVKSAGLGLSLLTLVGAGGIQSAGRHVEATAELLNGLELDRGDTVFLLDENEVRDLDADSGGFEPMIGACWFQQQETLKQSLAPLRERGVKVLPYSLEKQWA